MGRLYQFEIIILLAFAIFYYRLGVFEKASGILWCCLSLAVSLITWLLPGWGFLGITAGQVALFFVIWFARAIFGKSGMA